MENLYELTNPQKSIWLTEQYYKGTSVNNICGTVKLNFKIDFDVLRRAINLLIQNNDCLRIKFNIQNGIIKQFVSDYKFINIEIIDINTENEIKNIQNKLVSRVFDLENDYLFQFKIYRLPDGKGGYVLNIHHILGDSWCLGLISKEIIKAYNYLSGLSTEEPLTSSYVDFCVAEKEYMQSSKYEKDKEYWNSIFNTVPELASIPSSLKNTEEISCIAKRKTFIINKLLNSKINNYCRENRISVYNFLMSIYALYIGRVSNLTDFVIGTPILNRVNFKEKNTLGMFVSTQPLRVNIENSNTFKDLTSTIASNSLSMLRHQRYPYEDILKDLRKRNNNLPNLYNILLSYQITKATTEGIDYTTEWSFNGNCADELQIHIQDLNDLGELNISYDFKTQKYTDAEIEDLHKRILHIINQVLENTEIELNNIEIITEEEKEELLYKFNNTKKEYKFKNSIIEHIEEVAKKHPNKIALEDLSNSITYHELIEKVNKVANFIIKNYSFKEYSNIGVLTYRNMNTIISILAVLKINCTIVPIDPEYPLDRIQYMIESSKISHILTSEKYNGNLDINFINITNAIYDNYSDILEKKFEYNILNNLYIVFTSGSTGKPKGISLMHKNMLNLVFDEIYNTSLLNDITNIRILQFATMSFDVSYQEIFTSFLSGGTLVLVDDITRKNIDKLTNYIKEKNISVLFVPPAYLRILTEKENNIKDLSNSLKSVITAGESLVITEGIRRLLHNNIRLFNHYGPAETHVATTFLVTKNYTDLNVPIGSPISNSRIYILGSNNKLCPKNVIGQIAIAGDCVGNGYLNNTKLNESKFINDVFFPNNKMYLTGDLGFINTNNEIVYIGRSDFQVKINGFRIEPGEINNILLKYPLIKSSYTFIQEHLSKKYIVCFYTTDSSDLKEENLRGHMKQFLPQYMIPSKFVKLDFLPLTINGKIDRKQLPSVNFSESTLEIIPPSTHTEKELLKIYKNIFKENHLGINSSFFDIGGDSLLAIKLLSEIKENFNVDLNISNIYSNPTVKELSIVIENSKKILTKKVTKTEVQDYYELSSAQKRIFYASKASSNNLVYNICGGLLFNTILDKSKTEEIFNSLIAKYSSFRTCFKIIDGIPKQYILDAASIHIDVVNTTNEDVQNIINDFPKAFDLEIAPLLRVKLYYINNEQTLLLVDSHHIILDGTSLQLLIDEFCKMYNNESTSNLEIDYKDFSVWENNYNASSEFKILENNWKEKFYNVEIPVINLPYDFPVSQQKTFNGNTLHTTISNKTFEKIEALSKKYNVTPYVFCLTVFYVLLYRYTGQNNIIIGSPISGRFSKELENIIGMFVNNIPLQLQINSDTKFEELLETVKENVLFAIQNQPYPYDALVKLLNINSNTNLFDVMFTYQNENSDLPIIDSSAPKIIYANTKTSKFNLSLEIIPNTHTLNLEYNTDLFKENTVQNILEHYIYLLENISKDCNQNIDTLNMITPNEHSLLLKFNATEGPINNDTVSDLIEEQVRNHPDEIAIICENKTLTYKQLNEKANSLANYLVKNGVHSNDIIAIMTNRSFETIVSMLAIMKAGGAFLNIDPTYPLDRTKYYISSCNAQYVLTQKELKEIVKEIPNCVEIDLENNPIYETNKENPNVHKNMEDLSYIIYTSGSTGLPKGVMLNQIGFTNMAKAMTRALDYLRDGKHHTLLSVTSTPFDIFVYEIIVSLTHGLSIVMANNAEHRNPKLLDNLIKQHNVDVMTVTPSLMKILYDNREPDSSLKLVKNMVFGGEPLPEKFVKDLKSLADDITVFNIYGPSEITILSNVQNLNGETEITTGPPIMNTQMHILDKNMQPVPIGVVGEIYISGIQVGVGYLGNPELTNQKFLPNKFGSGRMYRSGDIGRWTFDGKIQCLGRVDHQIKLRGLRIELGEIENKIEQIPGVSAAIVNKFNIDSKEFLCGYYVTDGSKEVNESEVKSYIKKYLPPYMVPSYIIHLDEMPYTINRKIDRKALPAPSLNSDYKEIDPNKFTTNELKLLQIWKNILHIENISVDDNFFDIGGDSISAIKMQIEALKYDFNFEYADIFNHPTIKELSSKIKEENIELTSDIYKYDYTKINAVLNRNCFENISTISKFNVGNILLIGSTGFLGIHILENFLKNNSGDIYCLVRLKNNQKPEERLKEKLDFYFGKDFWKRNKTRIHIIQGDIINENLSLSDKNLQILKNNITTVINSGALVKHYGQSQLFEDINVNGTRNIVNFCKTLNKRLLHVSTISVSGNGEKDETVIETPENINNKKIFRESSLFINQKISGIYTVTKYKAEMIVLEAIYNGLDAQIIRMGNITNRYSDGCFQQNVNENAFAKRLKSFIEIGAYPEYLEQHSLELSPVDLCADAIIKILQHTSLLSVIHIYNSKLMPIKLLISVIRDLGFKFSGVNDELMTDIINGILNNDSKKDMLSGIIHDLDSEKHLVYTTNVRVNYELSEKYLNTLNFSWKNIDKEYIIKYMNYFKKIKFINF